MTSKPAIQFNHVSKYYPSAQGEVCALQDINLTVMQGEILGIIGRSGAGKSSLIRCINLLEQPTKGNIIVNDQDLQQLSSSQLRKARQQIGMIFQQFNLLHGKTVFQNIALALKVAGVAREKITTRVKELLQLVGLDNRAHHYPAQLSGGQKQRVAIARALANQPSILLCDEATSALDPESTYSILQLLREINHKLGITIVLITHEVEVIKIACDRVGLLDHGKLVQLKPVVEFFAQVPDSLLPHQTAALSYVGGTGWDPRLLAICTNAGISGLLLRLRFHGQSATQPLIAHLAKQFELEINILQANLELIGEHLVGNMIVHMSGGTQLEAGLAYLRARGIHVEELSHVH